MLESPLAPGLLLAMPQLEDPNFRRAVVLMIEHGEGGSFGLIMNRPGELKLADLLRAVDLEWAGEADARVGFGGPVMTASGWLLHEPRTGEAADGSSVSVAPGIELSTSQESLRRFAEHPPERFRFLLGYAGWGPGQLADELASGAWIQATATPDLVFHTNGPAMWQRAFHSVGVDPAAVVMPTGGVN